MTTVLPFSNNSITVYKYEPFSYTISNPYTPIVPVTTVSTGIPPSLVVTDVNKVVFSSSGYGGGTSSNELIVIDISGGTATSSNSVVIAAGRFRDVSGNSMSNNVFQFYKNEPITPVVFNASISMVSPLQAYPALPAGLSFAKTASNQFTLSGTPTVQVPTSNYQIVGQGSNPDTGKVVTTVVNMTVAAERLQLNVSGSPIVSPMSIGTPITQRSVYASFPLATPGNLRYTWNPLPSGLYFGDYLGLSQASGFQPVDVSYTLTLQGTPTLATAKSFAAAGITTYTTGVQALRLTSPNISNTTAFTFQFEPTVLFDDVTIPTYYNGVALDPSATSFRARTYFGTDASIASIFSPDLRTDFSLNFVSNQARAYLTGTPTFAGSGTYTIRASNVLGASRDLAATIVVSNDTVSFDYTVTPVPLDACYNFILSRPLSLAKTGYYPGSVQFKAATASGRNVTFSIPGLSSTGLSLSNVSSNTVQIVGIPSTVTPLTTFTAIASAVGSPATASTTFKASVLNDQFTFADVSSTLFNWIQNKAIDPIQITATTLSERPVIGYSIAGVPAGIAISPGGQITGAPLQDLSGTATVTASTGFASQNSTYSYSTRADDILVALANGVETVTGNFTGVEFRGISYSGSNATFHDVSGLLPYQSPVQLDLSMSSTGFLSGNLNSVSPIFPRYSFDVSTSVGQFYPAVPAKVVINVSNYQTPRHLLIGQSSTNVVYIAKKDDYAVRVNAAGVWETNPNFGSWTEVFQAPGGNLYDYDMAQSSNAICAVIGSNILRSTNNGDDWSYAQTENTGDLAFSAIANDGGSNWLAIGRNNGSAGPSSSTRTIIRQSSDDGATWTDISAATNFLTFGWQLIYNNGRYILAQEYGLGGGGYSPERPAIQWANASLPKTWTAVSAPFSNSAATSAAYGVAANGNTLVVSGGGPTTGVPAAYSSTDNGTTWTSLPGTSMLSDASGGAAFGVSYADGYYVIGGTNAAFPGDSVYAIYSRDLTTWSNLTDVSGGAGTQSVMFDGNAWILGSQNSNAIKTARLEPTAKSIVATYSTLPEIINVKRMLFRPISNGTPSATISIPYSPGGYSFVTPTVPYGPLFQYVSTSIPVQIQSAPNFIYYYASQLPRGLTLTPDTNGVGAVISGIPYQYSDRPSSTILFARIPQNGVVVVLQFPLRVILPSYQKRTDAASAFTSLLRQYTVVNAAQNARDNRVFPQVDQLLGEFTAPYPPNVITQTIDPKCKNPNC